MIDLNALHSMLGMKGFYYFNGSTNDVGDLMIEFYTEHSNQGDHFWLTMSGENSYDIDSRTRMGHFTYDGITENKVFQIINEL